MKNKHSFRLWAFGDCHVGTDKKRQRQSLAEAIIQSEAPGSNGNHPFDWDIAIDVGDMSGGQGVPEDEEGREIIRQFRALKKHQREDIYNICGNHDRSGIAEEQNWWWRKWLDPTGENQQFSGVNSSQRPYVIEGNWEHYSFRVGNILFLMMSDINEPSQSIGRGDLGGNPAGVVSGETFKWWQEMVEKNQDCIIVSAHHYMLKNTTVASGEWEGFKKDTNGNWQWHYHGYKPLGAPKGASYLYYVNSVPDAGAFEKYLEKHPGAIDFWLGGHTHTYPDDTCGGKSHIERKWGVNFINVCALTKYHGKTCCPMSRLLSFTEESAEVTVECYLHTADYAPPGWYQPATRKLAISRPFSYL